MPVRLLVALTAVLLAGAAPAPILINLADDFINVYDSTLKLPTVERVARFKTDVAAKFPGFYSPERTGRSAAEYDAAIARAFERFPGYERRFVATAAAASGQLAAAQADFVEVFPDAGAMAPAYLLHSLGEMDGGARDIKGKSVLIFGVDVIARVHAEGANERPFFEHELFHVYHEPKFRPCNAIWCALWEEGLATFVAASRSPGATPGELLLVDADLKALTSDPITAICTIRHVALSESEDDYRRLFTGGASVPGLPERAGYYIGYLVAQKLGETYSLKALAGWPVTVAKIKVLDTLSALAPNCAGGAGTAASSELTPML